MERIEFNRALVHELKTPLAPLLVCSEALVKSIKTEPDLSFARNMQTGALTLSKKIDELLDLARGEVGILRLHCRIIDPGKVIRETARYMEPGVRKKGLELRLEVPPALPKIRADKERLKQIVLNLVDNAIKYTQPGGVITVRARQRGTWFIFEVQDTGMGIDEHLQKQLFEPYKRFNNRGRIGGLGLGLVVSKQFVELHGGRISVTSNKGYGSTFAVSLPIRCEAGGKL